MLIKFTLYGRTQGHKIFQCFLKLQLSILKRTFAWIGRKKRVFRCTFFRSCFSFHDFPFNTFPFASISIAWFSFLQNSWIYYRIIKIFVEILNFFCSFVDFFLSLKYLLHLHSKFTFMAIKKYHSGRQ